MVNSQQSMSTTQRQNKDSMKIQSTECFETSRIVVISTRRVSVCGESVKISNSNTASPLGGKRLEPLMVQEIPGDVADASSLDPEKLGFMCGLEVHQQLATGKLHSRQPSTLYEDGIDEIEGLWPRAHRRLRAARGEGGRIDIAARFEQRRNRSFVYYQSPNAGLIEMDEAPPLEHDSDAVDVALTMAAMMSAKPVGALQAMRKTVVDGSNTSGFQRTTLIGTHGSIQTPSGPVGVDVICLEEDSARKLDTRSTPDGEQVVYTLDRLGVPLVEVATAPDVQTPEHAKETALALGTLLRDTRRVRRGLGSIRQDLNVSIGAGDRVEIKGCQDLDWIPRIIRLEMARQLHFYRLANQLRSSQNLPELPVHRDQDDSEIESSVAQKVDQIMPFELQKVTAEFAKCESKMVVDSIKSGAVVLGLSLPGLKGLLGSKQVDGEGSQLPRLGRELASAAKLAGVRGIFHSDELPAYGIGQEETDACQAILGDCFVLCVAPQWQAELALEGVHTRAKLAYHRIPQEVRNVVVRKGAPEDGTTTAMRPLPGGARMYPETDIPTTPIDPAHWNSIRSNLPPTRGERLARLSSTELSENQVNALVSGELDDHFMDGISGELQLPQKAWASALLDHGTAKLNALAVAIHLRETGVITREGVDPLVNDAETSSIPNLLSWMTSEAASRGFEPADTGAVDAAVAEVLEERADFVKERGMAALGPLMGVVMGKLGGAADGKAVSNALKEQIQRRL
ncbi:MAG: Glu-tRNA(Gln) amidotransferase GatDE subunit E [Planctomycetaceae bacterium]|nr:Glu-tRNA(Gln) amidotransferase GatDE subunit E [Planctomycetaceae bacterium]